MRRPVSTAGLYRASTRGARIEAHITGTVWKIEVAVGDQVAEGDTVVILESMKMEMPVEAEDDGTVAEIRVEEGQAVTEGDTLVVLSRWARSTVDTPADGVARVTIDNAAKRNALDRPILEGLASTLPELDARCIVVTGAGTVFSAGYDIGDLLA